MFQMYLKVGAMASFYPMKKHASWIPALARVEEYYYIRYRTKKEAVTEFLKKYGNFDEDLLWVYACGQTFYDWNFANLVRAYGDWDEAKLHCEQAEEFLGLNKKTDS